jgi:hypothetical protein
VLRKFSFCLSSVLSRFSGSGCTERTPRTRTRRHEDWPHRGYHSGADRLDAQKGRSSWSSSVNRRGEFHPSSPADDTPFRFYSTTTTPLLQQLPRYHLRTRVTVYHACTPYPTPNPAYSILRNSNIPWLLLLPYHQSLIQCNQRWQPKIDESDV